MSKEFRNILYYIFSSIILVLLITGFEVASEIASTPNFEQNSSSDVYALYSLRELSDNSQFNNEPIDSFAPIFLVFDFKKDAIVFSKNSNHRWPLASLTKLMTAAVALENLPKDKIIKISEKSVGTYQGSSKLKPGEEFKVLDLVKAAIISSSNEAALALSEVFLEEEFILLTNKKAEEIGLKDTIFKEPTGLSMLNQSTGEDVIKLVKYILRVHPLIFEISRLPKTIITERKSGAKIEIYNTHPFAGQPNFMGGKTGFTKTSDGNLLSIFENNKNLILIAVFGAEDRYEETKKIMDIYAQ